MTSEFVWTSFTMEVASRNLINIMPNFLPALIVIRSERVTVTSGTQLSNVIFPQEEDLENFTRINGMSPAVITIPAQLLVERSDCK